MKMNNYLKSMISGAIYNVIGKINALLFGFLFTVYLIRNYSLAEYGTYTLLLSSISLASISTSAGLLNVVERYAPEFYTKKDFNSLRKIFFLTVFGRLFLSILFIVILFNNSSILNILKLNTLQDFKIEFVIILITALQIQLIGDTFLVSLLQQKFYNLSYSAYYFLEFLSIYFSVKY